MAFDALHAGHEPRRTMDAGRLNAIANHPSVRPLIGMRDAGPLDYTTALRSPAVVCLEVEHGAFLFEQTDPAGDPGRWDLHTLLLPGGRGADVLPAAYGAFRFMFAETSCTEIVTKVPGSNRAADLMARRAGFSEMFRRAAAWEDGAAVSYFALTLDAWRAQDEGALAEGKRFHLELDAAKAKAGRLDPSHPDDEAHDRAAGAAVMMARAGQPLKAVWTYNRWARLAGYQSIELTSLAPLTIDVRDAFITFRASKLEILLCPPQP